MTIPVEHAHRSVYHFTHIENLSGILEHGLLATNEKERLGIAHNAIAYNDIQCRRADMDVTCGPGGVVHDYVPLYFCIKSPMLSAVVNYKIADEQLIIYLEFSVSIMEGHDCVFTDSSANTRVPPNFFEDPADLDEIDWEAVRTWRWGRQHDTGMQLPVKQRKMAELLVHSHLPISEITRIIVWSAGIRDEVFRIFDEAGVPRPAVALGGADFYFLMRGRSCPPVTGPYAIHQQYTSVVREILDAERPAQGDARYDTLGALLTALNESLEALPETAELIGLATENPMHGADVGEHTLAVVNTLVDLAEYTEFSRRDRGLLALAAFLHDIGKGPRTRWPNGRQQVDEDHPLKSMKMLKRVLVEDVARITERSVQVLCKLVCYHDLIGGIIGHGRRVEELEAIIDDENELALLSALCKADIICVNPDWYDAAAITRLIDRVIVTLRNRTAEEV